MRDKKTLEIFQTHFTSQLRFKQKQCDRKGLTTLNQQIEYWEQQQQQTDMEDMDANLARDQEGQASQQFQQKCQAQDLDCEPSNYNDYMQILSQKEMQLNHIITPQNGRRQNLADMAHTPPYQDNPQAKNRNQSQQFLQKKHKYYLYFKNLRKKYAQNEERKESRIDLDSNKNTRRRLSALLSVSRLFSPRQAPPPATALADCCSCRDPNRRNSRHPPAQRCTQTSWKSRYTPSRRSGTSARRRSRTSATRTKRARRRTFRRSTSRTAPASSPGRPRRRLLLTS